MILIYSILFGLWGVTASSVLSRTGEVFSFLPSLWKRLPEWLAKPLGACGKCHAGWVALLLFPFLPMEYNGVEHFLTVAGSIFTGHYAENRWV